MEERTLSSASQGACEALTLTNAPDKASKQRDTDWVSTTHDSRAPPSPSLCCRAGQACGGTKGCMPLHGPAGTNASC